MNKEVPPGYEQFWTQSESSIISGGFKESAKPASGLSARTLSPELSDGQISVALDSGLMQLIENITQELSRSTTGATSLVDALLIDNSRTSTLAGTKYSEFPPRAVTLNNSTGHRGVLPGVPPRSSTGYNNRPSFASSSGTTYADSTLLSMTFPPKAPIRGGRHIPLHAVSRFTSGRSESTTSRSQSAASDMEPLPQVLHALDNEPDKCIVVVRRITRLGFKSNRIIKTRFEQMGWDIRNVVLLPSRSRPAEGSPGGAVPHARPSSMGFVVFINAQQASECLTLGSIDVEGIEVLVQPFTRQYKPSNPRDTS